MLVARSYDVKRYVMIMFGNAISYLLEQHERQLLISNLLYK